MCLFDRFVFDLIVNQRQINQILQRERKAGGRQQWKHASVKDLKILQRERYCINQILQHERYCGGTRVHHARPCQTLVREFELQTNCKHFCDFVGPCIDSCDSDASVHHARPCPSGTNRSKDNPGVHQGQINRILQREREALLFEQRPGRATRLRRAATVDKQKERGAPKGPS